MTQPNVRKSDQRFSSKLSALFSISILASGPIWLAVGMPPFGYSFDETSVLISILLCIVTLGLGIMSIVVRIFELTSRRRQRKLDARFGRVPDSRGAAWNMSLQANEPKPIEYEGAPKNRLDRQ